jgi:hypothetical protein
MAEPRVPAYVEVSNFTVKETFDAKYKSSLPKLMMEAATKTIESKLKRIATTKKPSDKTSPAIFLSGSLALKQITDGFSADLSMPFGKLDLAKNTKSMKGAMSTSVDAQNATVEEVIRDMVSETLVDDLEDAINKSA